MTGPDEGEPGTEFQSLSDRIFMLENQFEEFNATRIVLLQELYDRIDHGIAQNAEMLQQNAEMLHLFKEAKQVVSFVRVAGLISMKFSAFIVAIAAAIAAVKVFIFGGPPPTAP